MWLNVNKHTEQKVIILILNQTDHEGNTRSGIMLQSNSETLYLQLQFSNLRFFVAIETFFAIFMKGKLILFTVR